jgi:predicted S18 family serine protease
MLDVQGALALWMKILGVLMILLGLTLLASPQIWYTQRTKVAVSPTTEVTSKGERVMVVPRVAAVVIVAAGFAALYAARRRS